jgi:hypothetical protein
MTVDVAVDPFVLQFAAQWMAVAELRRIVANGFVPNASDGGRFDAVTRRPDADLERCSAHDGDNAACDVWVRLRGSTWVVVGLRLATPAAALDPHFVPDAAQRQPLMRAVARIGPHAVVRASLARSPAVSPERWEKWLVGDRRTWMARSGRLLRTGEIVDERRGRDLYQDRGKARGGLPAALCLSPAGPGALGEPMFRSAATVASPVVLVFF